MSNTNAIKECITGLYETGDTQLISEQLNGIAMDAVEKNLFEVVKLVLKTSSTKQVVIRDTPHVMDDGTVVAPVATVGVDTMSLFNRACDLKQIRIAKYIAKNTDVNYRYEAFDAVLRNELYMLFDKFFAHVTDWNEVIREICRPRAYVDVGKLTDLLMRDDVNEDTILIAASEVGNIDMMNAAFSRGATFVNHAIEAACGAVCLDAVRLLVSKGAYEFQNTMRKLFGGYHKVENARRATDAFTREAVEIANLLIQSGCRDYETWFRIVQNLSPPEPETVDIAVDILTRNTIKYLYVTPEFALALLERGLPRERIAKYILADVVFTELDAFRDRARGVCREHMPNVLSDIVYSYCP